MNFRTLDLNLLRVFSVVMVERNVTRAAALLAMTQPAVSNALRRLRVAVGEDLFVAGPTGVSPTPYALAMWPAVRNAMAELREQFDPQVFDPAADKRSFTLGMADATASVLMPALVKHLEDQGSPVDVMVEPLTSRDPRLQLERGGMDAAVGFFPEVAQALVTSAGQAEFQHEILYHCRYVCVMRRGHPLALPDELTLDDYCAAKHVRVNFAGRPHGFVGEALARLGRERRVMMAVPYFAAAAQVVSQSDLLAVFPLSFVAVSGHADQLSVRALPIALPPIEVGLLWHRRHDRDPAQRWLRETIQLVTAEFDS